MRHRSWRRGLDRVRDQSLAEFPIIAGGSVAPRRVMIPRDGVGRRCGLSLRRRHCRGTHQSPGGPGKAIRLTDAPVPTTSTSATLGRDPGSIQRQLLAQDYLADRGLATAISLAIRLGRPLLLEGDAGVGKTEVAKVMAAMLDRDLIRLQCHDGIDASQALYDWDYPRQLLQLRAMEALGERAAAATLDDMADLLYTERFLLERPLLMALRAGDRAVLLIDEVDRADDEFEAFLLEVLSDFQVTIPELGTVKASEPPIVILTSNRTRDLHEALRRRALYHWIDHPTQEAEARIISLRAPEVPAGVARTVADVVARIRQLDLFKPPGVAESLDWARALTLLDITELDEQAMHDSLAALIKDRDDFQTVRVALDDLLAG